MKNQFNKENLEKLGIFELRNLAREIGVYSPTIYKKEKLIEKIFQIVEGQVEPYVSKSKQGRPPKSIYSVNNILDIFIPKKASEELEKNESSYLQQNWVDLNNLTAMEQNLNLQYNMVEEQKQVKAILEVFEDGYGLCYEKGYKTSQKEENFFVAGTTISLYKLKTGDILEGIVKKVSEDKPFILYKLLKINGILAENFNKNRPNFNELNAHYPTERIKFDANLFKLNHLYSNRFMPVGKGQRGIAIVPKGIDYSTLIIQYLNSIKSNENTCKLCMLIDERPEDITEYNKNLTDTKIIFTNVGDEPKEAIQKIELSLECAKRKVEENKDVILFISNLNHLSNLYKKQFINSNYNSAGQYETRSLMMVRKLLSNARKTENSGTFTILAIVEKNENQDFISSISELCNMKMVVDEKNYLKENKIWFNILTSETTKIQLMLNKEEFEAVQRLKENLTAENLEEKTKDLERELLKEIKKSAK